MTLSQAVLSAQRQFRISELLDEFAILRARFLQEGMAPPTWPRPEDSDDQIDWFALGVNLAATFPQSTDTKTFIRIGERHSKRVVALMEFSDEQWEIDVLNDDERDEINQFAELLMSGQIKYKKCA